MSDSMEFMQEESREILQDTGPESVSHTDSVIPPDEPAKPSSPQTDSDHGEFEAEALEDGAENMENGPDSQPDQKLQSSRQRPRRKAGKRGRPGEKNLSLKRRNPSQP